MIERRPFGGEEVLFEVADEVWRSLGPEDWLAAIEAHPRIGEREARSASRTTWSREEQSGMSTATDEVRGALAEGNRIYEAKFGHLFLICATGRSAEEMLAALRERLENDSATELRIAAEEQRKITRLRLEKLVRKPAGG